MIREALGEGLAEPRKQFKAPGLKSEEIVVTQGDPVDCILQ